MDAMSMAQIPKDLMTDAVGNLENPLMFGMPLSMLGEGVAETVVTSVVCAVADYLADEQVEQRIAEAVEHAAPGVLPASPYDRRRAMAEVLSAVCYEIGAR